MTQSRTMKMRQLVDWRATIIAALLGGLAHLLSLAIILPAVSGGTVWAILRYMASILMGTSVLPPPASFDAGIVLVGLLVHFLLSLIFGAILTTIIHRWGLLIGLLGGALFGLAIYAINYFTFTLLFDWFYVLRSWPILLAHVLFGATTGFIYELLEVERFVPVDVEA